MPEKKPSPVIEFVLAALKKNPKATFAQIAEAAKAKGLQVVPVVYGRARVMAGLSPKKGKAAKAKAKAKVKAQAQAKRGPGRPPGKRGPGRPPGKRGPGRPAKSAGDGLENLVTRIRQAERLEQALREIQRVLDRAL